MVCYYGCAGLKEYLMGLINSVLIFKYPALFIGAIAEGPVLMTAAGFIYKLGYLSFWPAYFALLLGDLAGDVAWYWLGYHGAHRFIRRFGKFFSITEDSVEKLKFLFRKHESKVLFINKITMGLGFTVGMLMAAGMSRVPLKKFIYINFLGGLIWTGFLMMLGYTFGNIYSQVEEGQRIVTIVACVAVFLLALNGFSRYMRSRMLNNKNTNL